MKSVDPLAIRDGNRRALAKAITLIESTAPSHAQEAQQLLETLLPYSGNSFRLGISGSPGVGKSTFIEAFGELILKQGHKLAILAVDPSSPITGGSLLADKTRMQSLANHPDVFIRPSPNAGHLGGIANKTREAMILCEAAGYNMVIVETVGVGQSEFQVSNMVDFFAVLMVPNAGDEIQGIKKGIIEIADAIIVTKSDNDNISAAEKTRLDYERALSLVARDKEWQTPVMTCSSSTKKGLREIWEILHQYRKSAELNNLISNRRQIQNLTWLDKLLHEIINSHFSSNSDLIKSREKLKKQVSSGETTPIKGAQQLIRWLMESSPNFDV